MTVDVREVARDLTDETLYNNATDILSFADNAYISSDIVNLLGRTIDETYSETYNEESYRIEAACDWLAGAVPKS